MREAARIAGADQTTVINTDNEAPSFPDWRENFVLLLIVAVLPMIGAQFVEGNQVEQFSLVLRILDPGAMPGDIYVSSATGFGPRFYFVHGLALLAGLVGLPLAVHGLSILCNLALAAVTYQAAGRFLGANQAGCAMAAILAVLNGGFSLGLAGYLHFDSFQPASIAIPLSLIGFYFLLSGRMIQAVLAFAVGSLMHPLIGVESALIAFAATGATLLLQPPPNGLARSMMAMIAAGAVFATIVIVAWVLPSVGNTGDRMSDAEFFQTLVAFRAPHHYLGTTFFRIQWIFAGIFCAAVAVVFALRIRRCGLTREVLVLAFAALIVIAACLASLWFVDHAESRAWSTAQLFRMTMLLKWVSFLVLAWLLGEWTSQGGMAEAALAAVTVAASGDALSYVLVLALAAKATIDFGRNRFGGRFWQFVVWAGVATVAVLSALIIRKYGDDREFVRAAIALLCAAVILSSRSNRAWGMVAASIIAAVALAATTVTRDRGLFGWEALKADLVWSDLTDDASDAARAAMRLSPSDALWLVPPTAEKFRIIAKRAVVVDFTSIPFEDAAMREWRKRMENLYNPGKATGFAAAKAMTQHYREGIDWASAAETYAATFALLYKETSWHGPILYENETYKLVQLAY
jgi:hypothetical protein